MATEELKQRGDVLYEDSRFLVTTKLLRTPRKTYQISRIEKTEVRRTALPFVLPISLALLCFYFWAARWMYWYEEVGAVVIALSILILAWLVGTLSIHSKALGEIATIDRVRRLQKVRAAVDDAIQRLDDQMTGHRMDTPRHGDEGGQH